MNTILIAGGGIVGLSAAIALKQRGFDVAVIDQATLNPTTLRATQRVYALNRASQHLLQQLGVWQQLSRTQYTPYQGMHIWDQSNQAILDFNARTLGVCELGYIIEETVLKNSLLQQCIKEGIHLLEAQSITHADMTHDHIAVYSAQEQAYLASFLIITDGANSTLRKHFKVPITTWSYHQHAIVATVQTEKPHEYNAYQVFTSTGPLAFLPLADPHQCSIVWSTATKHAQTLMQLSEASFNQHLTETFESHLGACQLKQDRQSFPLQMQHVKTYHDQRWLLMGDAAHTLHPLAGMGLNVGLADLSTWLEFIDQKPKMWMSQQTLNAYQRARKHAVWQTITLMEGLHRCYLHAAKPIRTLRGLGMHMLNRMSPLKTWIIRYAMGEIPQTKSGITPP